MNLSDEIRKQIEKNKGLKLAVGEINNHLSILENLVRKDIMEQVDEAYQKGFEDGKKEAESSEAIEQAKADAFNKGMLFKEEKIHDAYQRGLEEGKAQAERGCKGCEYEGKTGEHLPCEYCKNNFRPQWTAKDDRIEVGDEVEVLNSGNKYLIAWFAGTSLCGFAHDGVNCRLQPSDVRKTGRHFDIQSILEAMKND